MMRQFRIGFVDYRLDNFHANVYLKNYRDALKDRGGVVAGCWAMDAEGGRAWAQKNGVEYFARPEELDARVDGFMILAPSNPETHLDLCRKFLPFAKPTYVDKTFAPDTATAKEIFALADEHAAPVQTTSALRYTNVQEAVGTGEQAGVRHAVTWGSGSSFGEYAIHPVELAVSLMGPGAEALMRRNDGDRGQLLVNFTGGRTAVINVYPNGDTDFAAAATTAKGTKHFIVDGAKIFTNTAAAVLEFLQSGKPNVDRAESLTVRRILDAAEDPAALKEFVKL